MKDSVNIFWFRRDLRYFDNHGFFQALNDNRPVIPLFIFDTDILNDLSDKYDKRVNFIYHKLNYLNTVFQGHKSSILIKKGKPVDVFSELIQQYEVKNVFANRDYEPYAIKRDQEIEELLASHDINLKTYKDQVIFEKDEVTKANGEPYSIYTPYSRTWKRKFSEKHVQKHPSEDFLTNLYQKKYNFPFLEDVGFKPSWNHYPDEEPQEDLIKNYHLYRNFPAKDATSRIGIHLRFGTVSIRQMIKLGRKLNETWLNELIWREFYMMILYQHPYVVNQEFKPAYRWIPWRQSEEEFKRWQEGQTGFPMVDAGMRQLNETGYMHNRVRMITASFLVKHLLIDWRWGEAYFAEKLLDYELASNNGNWQWAAGSGCDAAPYFRVFNPTTQVHKFDPDKEYISKWLKEYGTSAYPKRIVSHKEARERALQTYKDALQTGG
ncbi:MAG: DNA photolyase family protein [Bacteroidales bacterium]|nr:DNA photolyase family protein [Bacteroidales bacterium]MCF8327549.1 DNA photolyase family protein [Bacteroidales bacterium]